MRRSTLGLAAMAAVGLVGAGSSARAEDTTLTFTLQAGTLSISAPSSANLGTAAVSTGTITGQLGAVTVSDQRGALAATWTASVTATDFAAGQATIPNDDIAYAAGLPTTTTGTAVVPVPGTIASLSDTPQTAYAATAVGTNSVTWNPTLTIRGTVAGTYSGTITHSVA